MNRVTALVALTLVVAAWPRQSAAGPIVHVSITPQAGGDFIFDYSLENGALDSNIYGFSLVFSTPLPAFTVDSPAGWDALTSPIAIDWFSTDPLFDLIVGGTLSGFSLTTARAPGTVNTVFLLADPDTGAPTDVAFGQTIGPAAAAVPEPGTATLLGLAGSIWMSRRLATRAARRKIQRSHRFA